MNVLIHPAYFPSIATFVAIVKAEGVVLEIQDNYQKQTYRNRCYIYGANGKLQLSVPVVYSQKNRAKYAEVKIANEYNWQDIHWKSLESAYRTSPFFEFYADELEPLFTETFDTLLEFNMKCFAVVCDCLQLDLTFSKTESFDKSPQNINDLRALVDAKKEKHHAFENYTQVFSNKHGYINNLSILDLLFNEGPNAQFYLESQNIY